MKNSESNTTEIKVDQSTPSDLQSPASSLRSVTISFKSKRRKIEERKHRRQKNLAQKHPIRAARLLALAHDIQTRIENGDFKDYAEVARHHQLTRARLTQIMNLLLLAPDIQEQILTMEAEVGREPISARELRKVLRSMDWADQRSTWTKAIKDKQKE